MPSCYKFLDFLDGSDVLIGWLHDPVDRALDGTSPGRLPHCTTFFFKVHVARPWLRSQVCGTRLTHWMPDVISSAEVASVCSSMCRMRAPQPILPWIVQSQCRVGLAR